ESMRGLVREKHTAAAVQNQNGLVNALEDVAGLIAEGIKVFCRMRSRYIFGSGPPRRGEEQRDSGKRHKREQHDRNGLGAGQRDSSKRGERHEEYEEKRFAPSHPRVAAGVTYAHSVLKLPGAALLPFTIPLSRFCRE